MDVNQRTLSAVHLILTVLSAPARYIKILLLAVRSTFEKSLFIPPMIQAFTIVLCLLIELPEMPLKFVDYNENFQNFDPFQNILRSLRVKHTYLFQLFNLNLLFQFKYHELSAIDQTA